MALAPHASGITDRAIERAEHAVSTPLGRRRGHHHAAVTRVLAGVDDLSHAIPIEPSLDEYPSTLRKFATALGAAAGDAGGARPRRAGMREAHEESEDGDGCLHRERAEVNGKKRTRIAVAVLGNDRMTGMMVPRVRQKVPRRAGVVPAPRQPWHTVPSGVTFGVRALADPRSRQARVALERRPGQARVTHPAIHGHVNGIRISPLRSIFVRIWWLSGCDLGGSR